MMLADLTAEHAWHYVVDAAVVIGAVVAVLVAHRKKETRKIEPDPLNVRVRKPTAKEEDCQTRHEHALGAVALLRSENNDEHRRIYDQIDTVERRMDDKLTEAMRQFNGSLQQMPLQIVSLLQSAGQIKQAHPMPVELPK